MRGAQRSRRRALPLALALALALTRGLLQPDLHRLHGGAGAAGQASLRRGAGRQQGIAAEAVGGGRLGSPLAPRSRAWLAAPLMRGLRAARHAAVPAQGLSRVVRGGRQPAGHHGGSAGVHDGRPRCGRWPARPSRSARTHALTAAAAAGGAAEHSRGRAAHHVLQLLAHGAGAGWRCECALRVRAAPAAAHVAAPAPQRCDQS